MAYFGVTADGEGLRAAEEPEAELRSILAAHLEGLGPGAPVVILIHGYKFDPRVPRINPHTSLFSHTPRAPSWKIRSWPEGLGFAHDGGETGLCIGFAWPAHARHVPHLIAGGRTGFAHVYDRAAEYGARLAELVEMIDTLDPGRPVDLLAHSLGARVALSALPHLARAPGRMILLGAAEFDARALEFLAAMPGGRRPEIYNVTARANDFYDAMFESFAPRQGWGERAVGLGLRAELPFWLDLQLDRSDVTEWINTRGIALKPAAARLCHWSFYTRDGAFAVYEAILRRRAGWSIETLRTAPCLAEQDPRWSTLRRRGRAAGAAVSGDDAPRGLESA